VWSSSLLQTAISRIKMAPETARLQTVWAPQSGNDTYNLRRPVAVSFPSRNIPLLCGWVAIPTYIGVIVFGDAHSSATTSVFFIEDVVKQQPAAPFFAWGMTVTSFLICITIVTNYGKVKNELGIVAGNLTMPQGTKRNVGSLVCGLFSTPFLGMLACADSVRMPVTHLICVFLFFCPTIAYMFLQTSVYRLLLDQRLEEILHRRSYALYRSVRAKRILCVCFTIFTALYLPVGMLLATWACHAIIPEVLQGRVGSDWVGKDWLVHTCRAACQHAAVLCIIMFYGTFYLDFGQLEFFVVQGIVERRVRKKSKRH